MNKAKGNNIYRTRSLISDIGGFLKPYKTKFIIGSMLRILSDMAWLYPAYGLAMLTNFLSTYHHGDSLEPVIDIFSIFAIVIVVRYVGQYYAKMFVFRTSARVNLDAQLASIMHMFKLDMFWHEHQNTGNKLKKIVRGGESIDRILRIWVNNFLEIWINLVGITFVVAKFDRAIACLTVVFLISYYVLAYTFRKHASVAAQIVNAKEEDVQGILFESINNIRTVKVLAMAGSLGILLKSEIADLFQKVQTRMFWFQTGGSVRSLYAQFFQLGVIGYIVYGISQGHYNVGFLILFYGYFGNILQSIGELAEITQDFIVAKLAVGRMMDLLHEEVTIDNEYEKQPFPEDWKKISFKNISFLYGENAVLEDVSFDIKRGERIGVVGLSGAGKSTLFKLLLKEHEDYRGEIMIDDIPLRTISKSSYFVHAAPVLQDTEVFNFSLRNNITLANADQVGNEELLERALRISHVADFISKLPEGVETLIGEKGVKLSGGERQRVGIARAVFKNPQILLLDEATSHLDIESEEKIRTSLHEFFQSVTAIVIAHRLTTIRGMDRIIVLEHGHIIEDGTFEELIKKQGRFFELWEKQKF